MVLCSTVEEGQLPHAPCNTSLISRLTLSMLTTPTFPPSYLYNKMNKFILNYIHIFQ
jgi:hypothetical protein